MEDAPGPTRATNPLQRRPGPLEHEIARRLAGQHPPEVGVGATRALPSTGLPSTEDRVAERPA